MNRRKLNREDHGKNRKFGYGATDRLSHPQAGIDAETELIASGLSLPLVYPCRSYGR